MCFPVAIKHDEDTSSFSSLEGGKPLWHRTSSAPECNCLLSDLNEHQEWSMPLKTYWLWVFQTSQPGTELQGGIAGPVLLLPVAGGLNQFKFVQTDILTSDETCWKVGCLHQWDPLEKALPQDWLWREPKENSYLWSLVSFWFRVCLTFWSLSKFDFCQVFFRGGGKTCKWVVLV